MRRERKVVAIGGGTGLSTLVRGLKHYPLDITAIVTVGDDGGSSGRLRDEFHMLPPGDIRNVILALSEVEPLMDKILQYRFDTGYGLEGHSLGNLMLTAATHICEGSFVKAIDVMSQLLNAQGKVLPVTETLMTLAAEFEDGTIVKGESKIPLHEQPIKRMFLLEEGIEPAPGVVEAIESADVIVLGPGSLYTSIIPNLLISAVREAIICSKVPVVYICNVMTQPGETKGYDAMKHLKVIESYLGKASIDTIVVNNEPIEEEYLERYREDGSEEVRFDRKKLRNYGTNVLAGDIVDYNREYIRHDSDAIAGLVMQRVLRIKKPRSFQELELK
ncbi:YvcK family protein [Exiguobacterium sp. MER 193]|uniref:gluconeogenesis factor YvcK family protein n=1 Tax=Exiguobacterium sp. MER 193 TaxID=2939564 RepID=UPI00203F0B4D|nr:gluconeogenesis factor YvcK family protein [Exiguobacterium sp. MER 193]MCM3279708.1 YvcK family protein [Exiguobacterium sp. MER 193]